MESAQERMAKMEALLGKRYVFMSFSVRYTFVVVIAIPVCSYHCYCNRYSITAHDLSHLSKKEKRRIYCFDEQSGCFPRPFCHETYCVYVINKTHKYQPKTSKTMRNRILSHIRVSYLCILHSCTLSAMIVFSNEYEKRTHGHYDVFHLCTSLSETKRDVLQPFLRATTSLPRSLRTERCTIGEEILQFHDKCVRDDRKSC